MVFVNRVTLVAKRVPLIKFRKGGHSASGPTPVTSATTTSSAPITGPNTVSLPVIEDWQLPMRYRRSVIDAKEMDCINYGGAV